MTTRQYVQSKQPNAYCGRNYTERLGRPYIVWSERGIWRVKIADGHTRTEAWRYAAKRLREASSMALATENGE